MSNDYNASEIDRLVRDYQERGREFARRGGTWLGAARSWIKRHCLNGERVTWGSNDVLQHDFTVDDVERIALEVATAVFDEFAATIAALSAAKAEVERLTEALTKISAIRDSIVGCQGFNFSEHAYPLVAVLDDAGFKGAGYEIASKNLGTLIEQRNAAERERDRLSARVRELELTEEEQWSLGEVAKVVTIRIQQEADPRIPIWLRGLEILDRLTKSGAK